MQAEGSDGPVQRSEERAVDSGGFSSLLARGKKAGVSPRAQPPKRHGAIVEGLRASLATKAKEVAKLERTKNKPSSSSARGGRGQDAHAVKPPAPSKKNVNVLESQISEAQDTLEQFDAALREEKERNGMLMELLEDSTKTMDELKDDRTKLAIQLESSVQTSANLTRALEEIQDLLEERAESATQYRALSEEMTALREQHKGLSDRADTMAQQNAALHEQCAALREQRAAFCKQEEALREQNERLQEQNETLQRQHGGEESRLTELETANASLMQESTRLHAERQSLEAEVHAEWQALQQERLEEQQATAQSKAYIQTLEAKVVRRGQKLKNAADQIRELQSKLVNVHISSSSTSPLERLDGGAVGGGAGRVPPVDLTSPPVSESAHTGAEVSMTSPPVGAITAASLGFSGKVGGSSAAVAKLVVKLENRLVEAGNRIQSLESQLQSAQPQRHAGVSPLSASGSEETASPRTESSLLSPQSLARRNQQFQPPPASLRTSPLPRSAERVRALTELGAARGGLDEGIFTREDLVSDEEETSSPKLSKKPDHAEQELADTPQDLHGDQWQKMSPGVTAEREEAREKRIQKLEAQLGSARVEIAEREELLKKHLAAIVEAKGIVRENAHLKTVLQEKNAELREAVQLIERKETRPLGEEETQSMMNKQVWRSRRLLDMQAKIESVQEHLAEERQTRRALQTDQHSFKRGKALAAVQTGCSIGKIEYILPIWDMLHPANAFEPASAMSRAIAAASFGTSLMERMKVLRKRNEQLEQQAHTSASCSAVPEEHEQLSDSRPVPSYQSYSSGSLKDMEGSPKGGMSGSLAGTRGKALYDPITVPSGGDLAGQMLDYEQNRLFGSLIARSARELER
ncbi:hypothetical protein CYMTET_34385 [Cymbomonas tetramitiformis]|uniref:Uncharacterized protein n=1 Tax=Cymbomonas tetramitiformis TaxID=36881 RepID=A0AAE0KQ08_9CHLO|nr:hypothetical protein CYMTET_34385 [Cymbomonas tetramitiformis]